MPRGRKKKGEEIQSGAPEAVGHEMTEQEHEALHAAGIPHTHDHEHVHDHEHSHAHGHGHTHSHEHTRSVLNRMSRAIGHLQHVRKMVEEGRDIYADPCSVIRAGAMLLSHIGYQEQADRLYKALDECAAEGKFVMTGRSDGATGEQYADYIMTKL